MTIEQHLSCRARPGHEVATGTLLRRLAQVTRRAPGCLGCHLQAPSEATGAWRLTGLWVSPEALWAASERPSPWLDELLREHCLTLRASTATLSQEARPAA